MDRVSQLFENYDLTISSQTTEVVHQPTPGRPNKKHIVTVKGQKLPVAYNFTFLLRTLSRAEHNANEVKKNRIA